MIYIIIGTRGQFIKMFPVMQLLKKHRLDYRFVSTSQHYGFIKRHWQKFQVRPPDFYLSHKEKDLTSLRQAIIWAAKVMFNAPRLPIKKRDWVIVHGNTESTFLGFLIGKLLGAQIIHFEAGVRTGNFLEPFPEELIDTFVSHLADVCFCPQRQNAQNLSKKKKVFITNGNTVIDSVRYSLKVKASPRVSQFKRRKFVLFLIRRKENLLFKKRIDSLFQILTLILKKGFKVIWPMHPNAQYSLKTKNEWPRIVNLQKKFDLKIEKLFDYIDFVHLIKLSQFVASDGAGLQNETYFLNKPMLILRKVTGNTPGLGETAFLSYFNLKRVNRFLNHYSQFKRPGPLTQTPSQVIIDFFIGQQEKDKDKRSRAKRLKSLDC